MPSGDLSHLIYIERRIAAGFASRCIDQTKLASIVQQANGNAGLAQQAFEFGLGWRVPVSGRVGFRGVIKVDVGPEFLDQQEVFVRARFGLV